MRVRDLMVEVEENSKLPIDKKDKLRNKMKDMFDVIERFEKNGEIHKDDEKKVETFRDFIKDFIESGDREKIIRGVK